MELRRNYERQLLLHEHPAQRQQVLLFLKRLLPSFATAATTPSIAAVAAAIATVAIRATPHTTVPSLQLQLGLRPGRVDDHFAKP